MEHTSTPIAVLISGRGSNLAALMQAVRDGRLHASIRVVLSNRADAPGLALARDGGIETMVVPHHAFPTREAYDAALAAALRERGVGLVCLAGFMRILGPGFCAAFPSAVLNVHPSLLPAFPGVDAQAQAFHHGVKVAGATVHLVTPELDAGPIVQQRAVEVRDDDTVASLAARILDVEHQIYAEAVERLLTTRWSIVGRRVVFESPSLSVR